MSIKLLGKYSAGNCMALYYEEDGRVTMFLSPDNKVDDIDVGCIIMDDPIVHVSLTGDIQENGYTAGMSYAYSQTSKELRLESHSIDNGTVVTVLKDTRGHKIIHRLTPLDRCNAFEVCSEFVNESGKKETIEGITSFCLSQLSPYKGSGMCGELIIHRLRSNWSAEGRLLSEKAVELNIEPTWAINGRRVEQYGNNCSMPVRAWMPIGMLEDRKAGVSFGVQIYSPSAWQIEYSCNGEKMSFMGGGGDYNHSHWRKSVENGESFMSVKSVISAAIGGVDEVSHNLVEAQRRGWDNAPSIEHDMPIMFNEYCTTWGNPTYENLEKIANVIAGHGITYMTIDAGWYRDENGWDRCMGDWIVNKDMFPNGIKAATDMIHSHGMIPGIWFEMESVGEFSKAYKKENMLLRRDGNVITTGSRRFLDLDNKEVWEYLDEKVIGLLKEAEFGYLKVDFNDTYGIGVDGYDSLGEGVRRQALASQEYFKHISDEIPGIVIENCASGGHRLEPSMMSLVSQASFSDAHECPVIPVVAANLHRQILPAQSQIWSVLHGTDSNERLYYSLIATFLGRMCLSGDVFNLNEKQWEIVDECIGFYKEVADIIDKGFSKKLSPEIESYHVLKGYQAMWREYDNRALLVVHRFECDDVVLDIPEGFELIKRCGSYISEVENSKLKIKGGLNAADAFLLKKV